jgi:putative NADH-flavin reductase
MLYTITHNAAYIHKIGAWEMYNSTILSPSNAIPTGLGLLQVSYSGTGSCVLGYSDKRQLIFQTSIPYRRSQFQIYSDRISALTHSRARRRCVFRSFVMVGHCPSYYKYLVCSIVKDYSHYMYQDAPVLNNIFSMAIKNVALFGANGKLGPAILDALLSAEAFNVTIFSRTSTRSKYPDSVTVTTIADRPSQEELVHALQGQDAVVVVFQGSFGFQISLAEAAAKAGVKRIIPADFGSCDSSSPRALELMPFYVNKKKVREHLQQLSATSCLTWTSLVTAHFFDWGLKTGLLKVNIAERKALIFDDGDVKWSATTLRTIGLAVVRILRKLEETKNRMLYIQSFSTSQNELMRSIGRVSGKDWQLKHVSSEEFIKQKKE